MEKKNAINVYTCEKCSERIVTINREDGTTPFMILCECGSMMLSCCYNCPQDLTPTYEWRKPSGREKMFLSACEKEHIKLCGLLRYKIKTNQFPNIRA